MTRPGLAQLRAFAQIAMNTFKVVDLALDRAVRERPDADRRVLSSRFYANRFRKMFEDCLELMWPARLAA